MTKSAKKPTSSRPRARKVAASGVFFNSLPKSGKNLVYTFFSRLDMQRVEILEDFNDEAHEIVFASHAGKFMFSHPSPMPDKPSEVDPTATAAKAVAALGILRKGQIAQKHLPFTPQLADAFAKTGRRSLFLWRDPRDVLVSTLNYARSQGKPSHFAPQLTDFGDEDAFLALLEGRGDLISFADYVEGFLGWINTPNVLTVCFEDLVGPAGGGTIERQRFTFAQICEHFSVEATPERIDEAAKASFNRRAGTFFRGQAGAWREQFTPRIEAAFEDRAGGLLNRWNKWRLTSLEAYVSGVDDRYLASEKALTTVRKSAEAAERELEAVIGGLGEKAPSGAIPVSKAVSRAISELDARASTAERRLAHALSEIETASSAYSALERKFNLRAQALNETQAELLNTIEAAKVKRDAVTIAQTLDLDPENPVASMKREIQTLRAASANQLHQIERLKINLSETQAARAEVESAYSAKRDAAAKQIEQLRNSLTDGVESKSGLVIRLDQLSNAYTNLLNRHDTAVLKADEERSRILSDLSSYEMQVQTLQQRLDKTEAKRMALADRLRELATTSNDTRDKLKALVKERAGEKAALARELEATLSAMQAQDAQAKSEIAGLEVKIEERDKALKAGEATAKAEIAALDTKIKERDKALKAGEATAKAEIAALDAKIKERDAAHKVATEMAQATIKDLEKRLQVSENALKEAKAAAEAATREFEQKLKARDEALAEAASRVSEQIGPI